MSNYIEFLIGPSGAKSTTLSDWNIRNNSIRRLMDATWPLLYRRQPLSREWVVRIHTGDKPTPPTKTEKDILEFQTVGDSISTPGLFPDWVFGGWWHMGMDSWDPFVDSLVEAGSRPWEDARANWRGAHLGVKQRKLYVEACGSNPDKFFGEFMEWGMNGKSNGFVSMQDQCRHAVLVDLTGLGYSGRLKMLGFCGRPLLVADRKYWCWGDQVLLSHGLHWFSGENLEGVAELYDEIMADYEASAQKALRLRELCLKNLTFQKACERAASLIKIGMDRSIKLL